MNPRPALAFLLVLPCFGSQRSEVVEARPTSRLDGPCEIPLEPYVGALRTVVAHSGELEAPFLFDTGGGFTILSLASARTLGLEPFGRSTGFRHDGERVDAARAGPVDLSLGSFTRHGEVGVLDLAALLGGLPEVGGILSLETFAGRAITVDLAANRLFVETPATLAERVRGASELVARIGTQADGATLDVFVAVQGRHGPLWFEIDSGNLAPVLVAPHAWVELGLEAPEPGRSRRIELPLVGLGLEPCEAENKEMIHDGLLNAAFFARHRISFDLAAGRVWVRPKS